MHSEHTRLDVAAEAADHVPAMQLVHWAEAERPSAVDDVPAAHLVDVRALVAAVVVEYVPAPHCGHVLAEAADHVPAAQLVLTITLYAVGAVDG